MKRKRLKEYCEDEQQLKRRKFSDPTPECNEEYDSDLDGSDIDSLPSTVFTSTSFEDSNRGVVSCPPTSIRSCEPSDIETNEFSHTAVSSEGPQTRFISEMPEEIECKKPKIAPDTQKLPAPTVTGNNCIIEWKTSRSFQKQVKSKKVFAWRKCSICKTIDGQTPSHITMIVSPCICEAGYVHPKCFNSTKSRLYQGDNSGVSYSSWGLYIILKMMLLFVFPIFKRIVPGSSYEGVYFNLPAFKCSKCGKDYSANQVRKRTRGSRSRRGSFQVTNVMIVFCHLLFFLWWCYHSGGSVVKIDGFWGLYYVSFLVLSRLLLSIIAVDFPSLTFSFDFWGNIILSGIMFKICVFDHEQYPMSTPADLHVFVHPFLPKYSSYSNAFLSWWTSSSSRLSHSLTKTSFLAILSVLFTTICKREYPMKFKLFESAVFFACVLMPPFLHRLLFQLFGPFLADSFNVACFSFLFANVLNWVLLVPWVFYSEFFGFFVLRAWNAILVESLEINDYLSTIF